MTVRRSFAMELVLGAASLGAAMLGAAMLSAAVLGGCGARSGLDVEARDAAPVERDAFHFVTFPCRWTLAPGTVELARGERFGELTGAVHPRLELVALAATEVRAGRLAWVITLTSRPELRFETRGFSRGALFAGQDGFLRQDASGCAVRGLDTALNPGPMAAWDGETCDLAQTRAGLIESVAVGDSADGAVHAVGTLFAGDTANRRIGAIVPMADRGLAIAEHDADVTYAFGLRDGRLSVQRIAPGGIDDAVLIDEAGTGVVFDAAPDRLRGGALVLFRGVSAEWRLVHIERAGPLVPRDVLDLAELPAAPTGQLETNETEALIPLVDGTLAYVPLARSHLRHLDEAVAGAPVEDIHLILRPEESAGGFLYVHRDRGEAVLRYQPLTCNR